MSIRKRVEKFKPSIKKDDNGSYIVFTGRAGMHFFDKNGDEFYVGSEMIISDKYSISILSYYIKPIESDSYDVLSRDQKNEILNNILKLCKQDNIRVKVDYLHYTPCE